MQGVNSVSGNSSTSFSTLASAQASLVSTTATTNTTNASKMLEAALQQMDGIISSATTTTATTATDTTNNSYTESFTSLQIPTYTEATQSGVNSNNGKKGIETRTTTAAAAAAAAASSNHEENTIFSNNMESLTLQICNLTKELAIIIKQLGITAPPPPDASSACIIADWLERHVPHPNVDDRMRSLQHDKDALTLQYQLLADRVHEQANKIIELEGLLTERTQQLSLKEDMLQRQLLTASALETQKLEFISALSELKLHRATLGRNALELTDLDTSINTNKSYGFAGSVGNLQNYDDANPNFSAASNATNADELIVANNMNIWGKNQQQQFHSLPRARGSKNFNNNNNNNNNNSNNSNSNISLNNKKNVWLQQQQQQQQQNDKNNNKKKNNNNNNNNNNNSAIDANNENVDCVCATTNSTNMLQKQRNVAFASNENIIDENPQLLQYLQQSLSRPSALTQQDHTPTTTIATTASPTLRERSAKGLRQILGKLRRSNSGNLELPMLDQTDVEFKRGGARATAAGRIERSKPISGTGADHVFIPNKAWADWSPPEICNWIADLQLGCYVNDCRKWLESNPRVNFFNATPEEIEKELNIKVPLHRKKIQYALDELTGREKDELALKAGKLDVGWVLRWLDDIGLPQYKESFLQAKLDGRMLHRLTMEDLASLHISSCLHIASLRRGIQIMREKAWNPDSLIRRSLKMVPSNPTTANDDEATNETSLKSNQTIECVALWTAFRVMEWLRVVDLSEYAPNLRGAGVHGALMLYEPRFNADLLADLLSIPPSKTLLRRHLATHFKELLGRDVIVAKRDTESLQGFQPLTITAKLKPLKKTQFSLKRRKSMKATENANCIGLISNAGLGTNRGSNEFDWSAFVCPMEQRVLNE